MDLCKTIFEQKVQDILEIETVDVTFLEQVLYLVHLSDWESGSLSESNGVDPTQEKNINYLKAALSKA
ncbi:phosphoglucose isomerase-like protein [Pontibacter ummariensis]|uniref:Phospho-glucose isomerase C-terminal SIS domain-containing protein n=1 Tax=Pontibacter ummariensis TaxID=1610492 RepID=A0A239CU28_9BACT|nr:SIS domain-containing protein [Pontibacter ummariensis]PRY14836.1 phosphoglucose isomerase-like protein [Pontibacter ummariensis]SNS23449.1 phospho-glucose isomerase C-terminal SIS domain-containing protein [Pontibacter ummariensis]